MHVPKEKIKVTMLVDRFRVVGEMHLYPGARLLDVVNVKEATFIAVTNAEIYSLADGKKLHQAAFIGINKNSVNFFYQIADDEVASEEAAGPVQPI